MIKKNAGGVLLATLLLSFAFFSLSAFAAEDRIVGGEVNVIAGVEAVLRIDLPKDITIRIEPGSREAYTVPVALNIYSNNPSGYYSYISTNKNRLSPDDTLASALNHVDDNRFKIDTLENTTTVEEFPAGFWGYSVDGGKTFNSVPAADDTPALANTDEGLYFGVKVPESQASGRYSTTIIATAVTRHVQTPDEYFDGIEYMQDMTQEICETENPGISKQLTDRRDGKKYWVTRMRDNSCWMTQNLDFEISDNGTTLTPADSNVFATRTITREATGDSNNIFYVDGGDYYIPNGDNYDDEGNPISTVELASDSLEWHYHIGSIYSWSAATAGSGNSNTRIGEADESICPAGWRLPVSEGAIVQDRSYSFYRMFLKQPETWLDDDYDGSFNINGIGMAPFYLMDARKYPTPTDYEYDTMPFLPVQNEDTNYNKYLERDARYSLATYWTSTAYPAMNPVGNSSYTYLWSWDSTGAADLALPYFIYEASKTNLLGSVYLNYNPYRAKRNNGGFVRCVSTKKDLYSITTMQEITPEIIRNTDAEATKRLVDTRDGKKYWVTKEQDGNIWMTENLDFEISTSGTQLSPATSDVLTAKTLTAEASFGTSSDGIYYLDEGNYYYGDVYSASDSSYLSTFQDKQDTESHFRVGDFYSWNAATAGSGAEVEENGGNAAESICPKGWRLPTSGDSNHYDDGSFETLYARVTEKGDDAKIENYRYEAYYYSYMGNISFSPFWFHYTGIIGSDGSKSDNSTATYWTSKFDSEEQNGSSRAHQFVLRDYSKSTIAFSNGYFPSGNDTENTAFGAKVRCVARNLESYTVSYNANGGFGAPSEVVGVSQSREHSIVISSAVPYRNGFTFAGWATSPSKIDAEYQPGDTLDFAQNAVTLYAVWETTFQKFNCSGLNNVGDAIKLTDERDGQQYEVRKLADGKCWMFDNLRLDFSNLQQDISPENTNNPSEEFMDAVNANPRPSDSSNWCTEYGSANCYNAIVYNTMNNGDTTIGSDGNMYNSYGTYYNWYTAAAGHDPFDDATATDPYGGKKLAGDICPSGWHLPTGGADGEFTVMTKLYPYPDKPKTIVRGGYYVGTTANSQGSGMYYWVADNTSSANMASWLNDGDTTGTWPRYYGSTVKCVADYQEQYLLIHDANGGVGGPDSQVQASDNGKATFVLSYRMPTRTNFTFGGWATTPNASKAEYQPGQDITVTNPVTRLYAVWITELQGFDCSTLRNTGDSAVAIDSRDGKSYGIAKLEDGNCWMTENLRLAFSNLSEDISNENTNNPTAEFISAANARPGYNSSWCSSSDASCTDKMQYYYTDYIYDSSSNSYVGNAYYNWYTATGGHGTYDKAYGFVADGDICPAGWHLPTGTGFGEFGQLSNALGGRHSDNGESYGMWSTTTPTGAEMSETLRSSQISLDLYGFYTGNGYYNSGSSGYYWTSFANTYSNTYNVDFSTSLVYMGTTSVSRYYGYGIRCVADYQKEYAVSYDANGGTNAPVAQFATSSKGNAKFTLSSNTPTRDGFTFLGWTAEQGARTATYQPGDVVAVLSSQPHLRLYAVWLASSTLQSFNCSSLTSVGDNVVVADVRDGKRYNVAKLADGKCWTEDLRLDFSELQEDISAANTNNPSSTFMTTVNAHPSSAYNWCTEESSTCYNQVLFYRYQTGADIIDYYYNWYTATAGQGTYSTSNATASGDICPYGWHLPTGGPYGDFANLSNALGGYQSGGAAQYMNENTVPKGASMSKLISTFPNNFEKVGYHYGEYQYVGVGRYWSSTSWGGNDNVRGLYTNDDYLDPSVYYGDQKYFGYSVRCLKN